MDTISLWFRLTFCGRKDHAKLLPRKPEFPVRSLWVPSRCVTPAGFIAWGWVEDQVISEDRKQGGK